MAGIQRLIKSGVRLYNCKPAINRLGASANSYRSFRSSSCSESQSTLSNVKRTFNVDTSAMINALKAEGIPVKSAEKVTSSMAQVLAELEKDPAHTPTLLKSKFESLRKNIKQMSVLDSTQDEISHSRRLVDEFIKQNSRRHKETAENIYKVRTDADIYLTIYLCILFVLAWLIKPHKDMLERPVTDQEKFYSWGRPWPRRSKNF